MAFRRLVGLVPRDRARLILGADSPEARRARARSRAARSRRSGWPRMPTGAQREIRPDGHRMTFELTARGEQLGHVTLPLIGAHNVRNALAALAVGRAAGLSTEEMIRAAARFPGRAAPAGAARDRARRLGLRRLRAPSDRDSRDAPRGALVVSRTGGSGRSSSRDRRRRAGACFRTTSRARSPTRAPTRSSSRPCFDRRSPNAERLSVDQLVRDLERAGRHARHIPTVDDIVATVASEAREGDLVVVMSNGGFDGIHDKLLTRSPGTCRSRCDGSTRSARSSGRDRRRDPDSGERAARAADDIPRGRAGGMAGRGPDAKRSSCGVLRGRSRRRRAGHRPRRRLERGGCRCRRAGHRLACCS